MDNLPEKEIRKRLTEILKKEKSLHKSLIENLAQKVIASGASFDCEFFQNHEKLAEGVCHNYTLDYNEPIHAYGIGDDIHDCTAFRRLEHEGLIQMENTLSKADVIVYLRSTNSFPAHVHSGKVVNGCIISRWGSSDAWKHGRIYVPSIYEYGDGSIQTLYFSINDLDAVHNFLRES